MNFLIATLFFSLFQLQSTTMLLSDNKCADIYPNGAKNLILVFLEIHEYYNVSTNFCENLIETLITDVIQIYKSIDDLNSKFNFSIGVRICDTCQNDKVSEILATENIIYLTQKLNNVNILCTKLINSSWLRKIQDQSIKLF